MPWPSSAAGSSSAPPAPASRSDASCKCDLAADPSAHYARAVHMRRPLLIGLAALALAGPFAVGYRLSEHSRATSRVALPNLVDQVREALDAEYYRPLPGKVLQLRSVDEIISALGDPYTAYLEPSSYKLVRQETA